MQHLIKSASLKNYISYSFLWGKFLFFTTLLSYQKEVLMHVKLLLSCKNVLKTAFYSTILTTIICNNQAEWSIQVWELAQSYFTLFKMNKVKNLHVSKKIHIPNPNTRSCYLFRKHFAHYWRRFQACLFLRSLQARSS